MHQILVSFLSKESRQTELLERISEKTMSHRLLGTYGSPSLLARQRLPAMLQMSVQRQVIQLWRVLGRDPLHSERRAAVPHYVARVGEVGSSVSIAFNRRDKISTEWHLVGLTSLEYTSKQCHLELQ